MEELLYLYVTIFPHAQKISKGPPTCGSHNLCTLTLKGQCKPHGFGIILGES